MHVRIYENAGNAAAERARFPAANAAGQTHTYQALYDPLTGKLQVARDGVGLGGWTDATPLTSGAYLALRTDGANVLFDDLVVSQVIKYYDADGQRVAMRKNGAVSCLFGDHLGSTTLTYNPANGQMQRQLYLPYGEPRWPNPSTLPTDRKFTGQRSEAAGLGSLYDYGARFYSPRLGRFLSADTIVPQPGNPQALNRYAYALNNPLRYTDPSGMFSEDETMGYFGVENWEGVLAQFEKGGALEGRWGWLEILRYAQLGDSITILKHTSSWPNTPSGVFPTMFEGVFAEQDGQLVVNGCYGTQVPGISGKRATLSASAAAALVPTTGYSGEYKYWGARFLTTAYMKYSHAKFHPDRVDWLGAGMDTAGIVADALSFGTGGRIVNGIQVSKTAGDISKALDYAGAARAGIALAVASSNGNSNWGNASDLGLALLGLGIPILPDMASLGTNFLSALTWSP